MTDSILVQFIASQIVLSTPTAVTVFYIATLLLGLLTAFFGYRILRFSLVLDGVTIGFVVGVGVFGVMLGEMGNTVGLILGIACAVLFGLIAVKACKAFIYFIGAFFGGFIGFFIPWSILSSLGLDPVGIVVGIVLGILFAILLAKGFYKMFKPLYIISTAFSGASVIFLSILNLVVDVDTYNANLFAFALAEIVLTILIAVFAAKAQFKMTEDRDMLND